MKKSIKFISRNAIIAALYVVLTLITYPFSYGPIQFRVAEILVLLCFFRKDYTFGLTLGCALSNIISTINPLDILFGAVATLLACLLTSFCKHLIVGVLPPIIINAGIVGLELTIFTEMDFWYNCLYVALGECVVMAFGYCLFILLKKRSGFYTLVQANQNIDFKF